MFDDKPVTWEYRVERLSQVQLVNQLNFMGKEGWEMITLLHNADEEYPYECFFKRPRGGQY